MVRARRPAVVLLAISVVAIALAGCVGPEEPDAATDPDGAAPTADTGAVKGQVVTQDLDHVAGATVALVLDGEIAKEAKTDQNGGYLFNGVEPGHYRVQVSAICCKSALGTAHVEAQSIVEVNFQLDVLSDDDLKIPRVDELEWEGFISCGVGTAAVSVALCSITGDTPAEDANEEFSIDFPVYEGLKSVVVGVDWEPVGSVFGTELWLNFEDWHGCSTACEDVKYWGDVAGGPGIVLRVDHDTNDEVTYYQEEGNADNATAHDWDNYLEGEDEFRFRMFASGNANLLYQQPFTVYYHLFYHEKAPEDYDPFPDA